MTVENQGPLHGIRILDACDELAVYATKLLVNLGAEVVRIEPPGGDPMRRFPPLVEDVSLYFEHFNAGKRSVMLDLARDEGLAWLGKLVGSCNAVVESGAPDTLLSARFGRERLLSLRPGLVLVSVTPFGLSGPKRDWVAEDMVIAADSGLLALNGRPDGRPYRPGGEQAAHMAGLLAANAALLGVFEQQRSGRGRSVEVPVCFAAELATLQTANANYFTWHGRVPKRRGMGQLPAFRSLFEARDGWVIVIVLPGQWPNCLKLLREHGAEADLGAPDYEDDKYRHEHAAHVNEVIAAFTARYDKRYVFEAAQKAGLAITPVNSPADLLADPFLNERGFFREIEQPALGRPLRYPGPPFHFGERQIGTWRPAPAAGQDNRALLVEELGMSETALAAPRGVNA